jgi:hypothetical protein
MKHCSKELGLMLKEKGLNLKVQYVYSHEKGTVVYNNGHLFSPLEKDIPLFTEAQFDRLLPKYLKIAFKNGQPVVFNQKTGKYLDYTVSNNTVDAKARAMLIYFNLEESAIKKANKNNIEVMEVFGNNDKMTITVKGIDDWSNSEIREIIEEAFSSLIPDDRFR